MKKRTKLAIGAAVCTVAAVVVCCVLLIPGLAGQEAPSAASLTEQTVSQETVGESAAAKDTAANAGQNESEALDGYDATAEKNGYLSGKLVLTCDNPTGTDAARAFSMKRTKAALEKRGITVKQVVAKANADHGTIVEAAFDTSDDAADVAQRAEKVKGVGQAQPDYVYHLLETDGSSASSTDALASESSSVSTEHDDTDFTPSTDMAGATSSSASSSASSLSGEAAGAADVVSSSSSASQSESASSYSTASSPSGITSDSTTAAATRNQAADDLVAQAVTNDPGALPATTVKAVRNKANQYYLYGRQSGKVKGASVTKAWSSAKANGKVTVAVLDTGVNLMHPDLRANLDVAHAYDAYNNKLLASECSSGGFTGDRVGHGTHVTGIISGVANNERGIAGVSYNAKVLPIKVFDNQSGSKAATSTSQLLRAYNYLESLVKKGEITNLRVINMSLGGYKHSKDARLNSMIKKFYRSYHTVTVCAGGNGDMKSRPNTMHLYPGDFKTAVCVTALNANGANARWSDYNRSKDISAPGVSILSTWKTEGNVDDGYTFMDGSSMAAPIVSGTAALCFAANPKATPAQVVKALKTTTGKIHDPSDPYHRNRAGRSGSTGALNAAAAVKAIKHPAVLSANVRKGGKYLSGKKRTRAAYRVRKAAIGTHAGTVFYQRCRVSKKAKAATVPAKVKIKGRTYRVIGISPRAFSTRGKVRTVTVRSGSLTKRSAVKGCLKASKVKTVRVRVPKKSRSAVCKALGKSAWTGKGVRVVTA
ncbi:MAG: S8 family peptidase [Eggerthellaceae bacterium]|jgi:subtilisin family serine protease